MAYTRTISLTKEANEKIEKLKDIDKNFNLSKFISRTLEKLD